MTQNDMKTSSNAPSSPVPDQPGLRIEQAIGMTVRALRKKLGLTVGELASISGLSLAMLSKVENGQISPSLSTLTKVSDSLKVPIGRLFADFDERRDCSYVPAGAGVTINRRGTKRGHAYQVLGATLAGDLACEPYLITLDIDATSHASFRHDGLEFIYMLSGHIEYRHGESTYQLTPGDSLLFDSAAAHGPERLYKLPATYLSIIVYTRRL